MPTRKQPKDGRPTASWAPTLKPEMTECIEFLGNWNRSLFEFYVERMQQYLKAPLEVSPFSLPEEHLQFQERFWTKLVADYAEQADRLAALVEREQRAACEPSASGYEERLLKAQDDAAQIIALAKAQAEHIIASAEAHAGRIAGETEAGKSAMAGKRRKSA